MSGSQGRKVTPIVPGHSGDALMLVVVIVVREQKCKASWRECCQAFKASNTSKPDCARPQCVNADGHGHQQKQHHQHQWH